MGLHRGARMENLPDCVLLKIFIKLLAKQLAQMRCVSKSWNVLLSQPSFIKSHLNRSIQNNNDDGVLFVFSKLFSFASNPFTAHPSQSPNLGLTNIINLPVNPQSNNRRGKVIGSVNGLICFKYGSQNDSEFDYGSNHDSEAIYIWNPSLSALLTLPPYYIPSHTVEKFFRFGFDPKTNDYKVVKIMRRVEIRAIEVYIKEWLPVEVYSMRNGSWKLITQNIPSHLTDIRDFDDVCVDGYHGHIHWLAETNSMLNSVNTVFAFDLGEETFCEMSLPKSVTNLIVFDNANDVTIDLGVLGGKLCVISTAYPDYEWKVWVMEEYGVTESWVKYHVFPPFNGHLNPYGFTLHNEFLFQVNPHGLALYDPVVAKTKIFQFGGECKRTGKVVEYVDSLVWVTPVEQREMKCCNISHFQF